MSNKEETTVERQQNMTTAAGQEGMELREIVALLWNGKWWIAGFVFAGLALSLAYAFLATPVYRADAMIQIQQQNSSLSTLGGQSDILSSLFGANSQAQAEIQIMTSRAVIDPVIRKMNLDVEIKNVPYGAVEVRQVKVPSSWYDKELTLRSQGGGAYTFMGPEGQNLLTGQVGKTASTASGGVVINISTLDLAKGESAAIVRQPLQQAFSEISKRLNAVELGHDTGIVQMSLLGTHPSHVSDVLNALVNQYLDQNVAAYSAQARRSLQFVNKQLPDLKKQMNKAEDRLTDYQVSHNTININEQAKALLQEFNTLEGELTQLQLAEAALGQQYTSRYPAYAAMEQQKANVQKRIKALEARIDNLPKDEQGYVRLKRDAEVYTTLYTTLLGKEQDLRVAAAGSVGSARVVDDAVRPLKPVRPKKLLIIVLACILGFGFAVAAIFVRHSLWRGLKDPVEIENRFGIPMYAVISHSKMEDRLYRKRRSASYKRPSILAQSSPSEPTVEALRSLRTSLDFELRRAKNQIVGLTGPAPNIGKSFVSVNLAYLAASANKRTLLLDADLRRGHLHSYLGVSASPGLSDLLAKGDEFEELVKRNLFDMPLDFLPTGAYPENPAELFLKRDIGDVLQRVGNGYDLVVVDLPPVLSVVDPIIAMTATGVNLMVLRSGSHTANQMAFALARLNQHKIRTAGLILNNTAQGRLLGVYDYSQSYSYKAR